MNTAKKQFYSTENIVLMLSIFGLIFGLLYGLASVLYKDKKIKNEIARITEQNQEYIREIEDKKRYLEYLNTPQRIDKEAKIQMGRKQPGEKVLVFIQEKLDIVPLPKKPTLHRIQEPDVPNWKRWQWRFLGTIQ